MEHPAARRSGLLTALDVAIAPRTAFANLREAPTWGGAFILSMLLAMIAAFAMSPAVAHALALELPARLAASPQIAHLPAAQREALIAQQVGIAQAVAKFTFIFVPFALALGSLIQALVMLVANAIGKGDGTFRRFWALAVNGAVIGTGLASLALLLIVLIRGADGFSSSSDISNALPGLETFVPASAKAAAAFFSVINVFTIWNMALLAAGMTIVARLPRATAILTAAVMLVGSGLFPLVGSLFAK
jgi:hypothetical protein